MNYMQPSGYSRQWTLPMAWFPVLIGLTVICMESTRTMSAANTGAWLTGFCDWLWGHVNESSVSTANIVLRKLGHFCGYGTLALLFRRAWIITFRLTWKGPRSRLLFSASALAVACTFFVASMDELHQSFLPGRTSSFHDVMLDTAGALLFNWGMMLVLKRRRRALLDSPPAWAR
jgi:VanZ family protein